MIADLQAQLDAANERIDQLESDNEALEDTNETLQEDKKELFAPTPTTVSEAG